MPRVPRQVAWVKMGEPEKMDLVLTDLDVNDDEHNAITAKLDTIYGMLRNILISVTVGTIMLAINLIVLFVRG